MNAHCNMLTLTLLACLFAGAPAVAQQEHAIFVDGSWSPDNSASNLDDFMDDELAAARAAMMRLNPDLMASTVDNLTDFERELRAVSCGDGDILNLVIMAHGSADPAAILFAKEGRTVTATALLGLLDEIAPGCGCRVNIVLFACASASFQRTLLEDEHVQTVIMSSRLQERTLVPAFRRPDGEIDDPGDDWMSTFTDALQAVPDGVSITDAIRRAAGVASSRLPVALIADNERQEADRPSGPRGQNPQAVIRGPATIVVHVEKTPRRRRGNEPRELEVTAWDPEVLRGRELKIVEGDPPNFRIPDEAERCTWWELDVEIAHPLGTKDHVLTGPMTHVDPRSARVTGHVLAVDRRRSRARVHVLYPRWLIGERITVSGVLDDDLQRCRWIDQDVTFDQPGGRTTSAAEPIVPTTQRFQVKIRYEGVRNQVLGTHRFQLLRPDWLGRYIGGLMDVSFIAPPGTRSGDALWLDLEIRPDGTTVVTAARRAVSGNDRR